MNLKRYCILVGKIKTLEISIREYLLTEALRIEAKTNSWLKARAPHKDGK